MPIRHRRFCRVLGVEATRVITLPQYTGSNSNKGFWTSRLERRWIISQEPFVVVTHDQHDDEPEWALSRGFISARQIHRGELGRSVPIVGEYEVVQGRVLDPRDNDRKGFLGWVKLSDLVRLTAIDPIEILQWFSRFSASTHYEPNIFVLFGEDPRHSYCEPHRLYTDTLPRSFCAGEEMWGGPQEIGNANKVACLLSSVVDDIRAGVRPGPYGDFDFKEIWVTQGMAQVILRLVQFGYRPGQEEPHPSFELAAKPVDLPAFSLPALEHGAPPRP